MNALLYRLISEADFGVEMLTGFILAASLDTPGALGRRTVLRSHIEGE